MFIISASMLNVPVPYIHFEIYNRTDLRRAQFNSRFFCVISNTNSFYQQQ